MAVENPPAFMQAGQYSAGAYRRVVEALSGDSEGVLDAAHLVVAEKAGGTDMSVDVSAGKAFVLGTETTTQGSYFVVSGSTENLAVAAADATNPRIDLVVAKVEDSEFSGVTDAWSLAVVTGTAAASPVAPSAPANSLTLAQVSVPASAVQITVSDITNVVSVWGGTAAGTSQFAADSVTTVKIAADAVTADAIAADSVTAAEIVDDAVTAAKIAADSVTAAKIAADAVTTVKIVDGAVGSSALPSSSVGTVELAADAVTADALAANSVTTAKLASPLASVSVTGDLTLDGGLLGEAVSYSDTANPSIVWHTEECYYARFKDWVKFSMKLIYSSGSSVIKFTLPVTPADAEEASTNVTIRIFDVSSNRSYTAHAYHDTGSTYKMYMWDAAAGLINSFLAAAQVSQNVPIGLSAGNDIIVVEGFYRVST